MKSIFNKIELKSRRSYLRKNMTKAEIVLWSRLKNSQLGGLKFRRQASIANYIVDFYCPSRKLAVELDGDVHGHPSRVDSDLKRQADIESLGVAVVRFTNSEVMQNTESVLQKILDEAGVE